MNDPKKNQTSQLLNRWKEKPQYYFRDVLGVNKIWKLQDDLLNACPRAIKEHKHIYIASGHSLGKDYICGGIGLWFLDCYKSSIVIQTAPTERQVKKVMWGETLRHWSNRPEELGGKIYTDPYIEIVKGEWYLIGFTTKESGASKVSGGGKFQGFHAPSVCVIVTEAQAIEDDIFDQIDAVTTNENVLVIFLGNPTRASGRFAKGLRDKENNIVFNFSCLDNPNYKHKDTIIPGLCSHHWVEDKRTKWGENDPRWQGRVLGQVPDKSINNVFSRGLVEAGVKRDVIIGKKWNNGVSMDVAGEGADDNVIYGGKRGLVCDAIIRNISTPSQNAIDCVKMAEEQDANFIVIDCDGIGIGTWQELAKIPFISNKYNIIKFHGSKNYSRDGMKNPSNYQNLRAEAIFTAKERLERGEAHIPNDELLIEELLEVKYFENKRGLIQIEDNSDLKDRLGRSPDRMMAWVMYQWAIDKEYEPLRNVKVDMYAESYDSDYDPMPA